MILIIRIMRIIIIIYYIKHFTTRDIIRKYYLSGWAQTLRIDKKNPQCRDTGAACHVASYHSSIFVLHPVMLLLFLFRMYWITKHSSHCDESSISWEFSHINCCILGGCPIISCFFGVDVQKCLNVFMLNSLRLSTL